MPGPGRGGFGGGGFGRGGGFRGGFRGGFGPGRGPLFGPRIGPLGMLLRHEKDDVFVQDRVQLSQVELVGGLACAPCW